METGLIVMPQDFRIVSRATLPVPVDHGDAAVKRPVSSTANGRAMVSRAPSGSSA
jgi:hypothetical protein